MIARSPALIGLMLLVVRAMGQTPDHAPAPAWVRSVSTEGATISDRTTVKDGAEFLVVDDQFNLGERTYYYHEVVRLTDPTAVQHFSRITVAIDPTYQQLTFHTVRIRRAGQVIDKYDAGSVQVMHRETEMEAYLYDDSRTVVLELKDVRPGDELEFAYSVRGWNPSFGDRFQAYAMWNWNVPVGRRSIRFVVPSGRPTRFFSRLGAPELQHRAIAGGTEWWLEATDLAAKVGEDNEPPEHEVLSYVEATEFSDWDEVRAWALDLFGPPPALPTSLQARVARWNAIPDVLPRMDSAWALVRDELRYLGLEGGLSAYKPHPPEQVYAQRFGDCKDMSLLLVTLLRAVGAEAWPALVNTYRGVALDRATPRADAFDHCIVVTAYNGERMWLDPTNSYARGTVLNHHVDDDGWALVLEPTARGLEHMPAEEPGEIEAEEHLKVLAVNGAAELKVTTTYKGRPADIMRGQIASMGISGLTDSYLEYYQGQYGEAEVMRTMEVEDRADIGRLILHEWYRLPAPWEHIGDDTTSGNVRILFSPGTVLEYLPVPAAEQRTSPYGIGHPVRVSEYLEVEMPENWNVEEDSFRVEGHGIRFSLHVSGSGRYSRVEYIYDRTERRVEASDFKAFQEQQARINEVLTRQWSWGEEEPAVKRDFRPHELMHWLLFLALAIWLCTRIWRYDPEPLSMQYPGRAIGGWLILPMLGVLVSPLWTVLQLLKDDKHLIFLTDTLPSISGERPVLAHVYVYFTQLTTAFELTFFITLLLLFFTRRTSVRHLMVFRFAYAIITAALDWAMYHMLDLEGSYGPYPGMHVGRLFIAACIWIPYFLISQRVRDTFVIRLDEHRPPVVPTPAGPPSSAIPPPSGPAPGAGGA